MILQLRQEILETMWCILNFLSLKIEASLSKFPGLSAYPQKTMFLSDPLTFAYRAKPENILMVNAKYDILFCRSSTEKLWDGFGNNAGYLSNE